MEEYYSKYAKASDKPSISEAKSKLEDWQFHTKKEIEQLIFIINSIDNDTRTSLSQASKLKLVSVLENLKANCIGILNKISNVLCRIDTEEFSDVSNKIYAKIEHIRNEYDKQLESNHKTLLETEIYSEFKTEYYKTQQWLKENRHAQTNRHYYDPNLSNYHLQQPNQSNQKISKASTYANIPKLNINKAKESASRNKATNITNNHHSVFTKLFLEKERSNKDKLLSNQSSESEGNEFRAKQRPLSARSKIPQRNSKQDSILNYTDIVSNKSPQCSDQLSQIIQIKTEIMLIQDDIKKLKGKASLKAPKDNSIDQGLVYQLTKQNDRLWSEMSTMRKEMNALFTTVKTLNYKISDILEDNKTLAQENSQLKSHLNQYKLNKNNQPNARNVINSISISRNSNSASYLLCPQSKTDRNRNSNHIREIEPIIEAQKLNYQYDSSCGNSLADLPENRSNNSKD